MTAGELYFIWGEESFLIDQKIEELHRAMEQESGEAVELLYLDADELTPQRLLEELEFSPLFALQRMVVIKRPSWLGKSQRKASRNEEVLKILNNYMQTPSPGQTLVITAAEHNSSNPLVKLLDKEAKVYECHSPTPSYLSGWIKDKFAGRGRKIEAAALGMILKSGQDLYYLDNMIEAICLSYPGGTVGVKEVEGQLEPRDEIKVFKLTDALMERNLNTSFRAFYQLLEQGEHSVFILYMIVRQFLSLGKVKYYQETGVDNKEISRVTGMKEFAVRKLTGFSRNFTWDELKFLFEQALDVDIRFKSSGQDDKTVMESLIIQICAKK